VKNANSTATAVLEKAPLEEWSDAVHTRGSSMPAVEVHVRPRAPRRKRLTVYLPVSLLERLRNAVYWTKGTTLAGLLEAALNESLDRRERQYGQPFPKRLAELKGGRPKRRP
jgi:hypothetical protein